MSRTFRANLNKFRANPLVRFILLNPVLYFLLSIHFGQLREDYSNKLLEDSENWDGALAEVTKSWSVSSTSLSTSAGGSTLFVEYKFLVDGKEYFGSGSSGTDRNEGFETPIYYNPKNPNENYWDGGGGINSDVKDRYILWWQLNALFGALCIAFWIFGLDSKYVIEVTKKLTGDTTPSR